MRHLTDDGLALIKRFEGFAPEVYVCTGGWPTIGYGHVVRDAERERFADGIDEATAAKLLRRDVEAAERAVLRPHPGAPRGRPIRRTLFLRLQPRRRRAAALHAPAESEPRGA